MTAIRVVEISTDVALVGSGGGVEETLINEVRTVYVSNDGDDDEGDGTSAAPWRSLHMPVRSAPRLWRCTDPATPVGYRVKAPAGYRAPIGNLTFPTIRYEGLPIGETASTSLFAFFRFESYTPDDEDFNTTADERFEAIAGPLTPSSAVAFGGDCAKYTMPGGTILENEQWHGHLVRIYQSGVEVSRAWVYRSVASSQLLEVVPYTAYTPASTDVLRIVRPSAVLGGNGANDFDDSAISQIDALGLDRGIVPVFHTFRIIDGVVYRGHWNADFLFCQTHLDGQPRVGGQHNRPIQHSDMRAKGAAGLSTSLSGGVSVSDPLAPGVCITHLDDAATDEWAQAAEGNVTISTGSCMLGGYRANQSPGSPGALVIDGAALVRGFFDGYTAEYRQMFVSISGGSTGRPAKIVPVAEGYTFRMRAGARLEYGGTIAVDAAAVKTGGGLIDVTDSSVGRANPQSTPALLVPMDAAVPAMSFGLVLKVNREGGGFVRATNTLRGASSVDVQAGANSAISYATLDAITSTTTTAADRDNDTRRNAWVSCGSLP